MKVNVDKYLTPYKLGKPVLTGSGVEGTFDCVAVDCPFVFFHQNRFYMLYTGFDGKGYQTGIAVSDDLIHWEKKGLVLGREGNAGWDRVGVSGNWIIRDNNNLYDYPRIKKIDGKYWMVYHSYPDEGYETGPAEIGLAWTTDENLLEWNRLDRPVFSWRDGSLWESGGLYKPCLIEHEGKYYLFFNAKNSAPGRWLEQTGVAMSTDLLHWKRYEGNPVLRVSEGAWDSRFCSDPYVTKDGDTWLMFYYGYSPGHAQDGLAVSSDLFHWEKYPEPILTAGNPGEIDERHAHKPSIIYHNGTLYHFYTAVRLFRDGDPGKSLFNEFRCITVAASKPFDKT